MVSGSDRRLARQQQRQHHGAGGGGGAVARPNRQRRSATSRTSPPDVVQAGTPPRNGYWYTYNDTTCDPDAIPDPRRWRRASRRHSSCDPDDAAPCRRRPWRCTPSGAAARCGAPAWAPTSPSPRRPMAGATWEPRSRTTHGVQGHHVLGHDPRRELADVEAELPREVPDGRERQGDRGATAVLRRGRGRLGQVQRRLGPDFPLPSAGNWPRSRSTVRRRLQVQARGLGQAVPVEPGPHDRDPDPDAGTEMVSTSTSGSTASTSTSSSRLKPPRQRTFGPAAPGLLRGRRERSMQRGKMPMNNHARTLVLACFSLGLAAFACAGVKEAPRPAATAAAAAPASRPGRRLRRHRPQINPCAGGCAPTSRPTRSPTAASPATRRRSSAPRAGRRRRPCIIEPQENSLFPNNWLRPRFRFTAGARRCTRSGCTPPTRPTTWSSTPATRRGRCRKPMWQALALHTRDMPITVTVRSAPPGRRAGAASARRSHFTIAPVRRERQDGLLVDVGDDLLQRPADRQRDPAQRASRSVTRASSRCWTAAPRSRCNRRPGENARPVRCIGCHTLDARRRVHLVQRLSTPGARCWRRARRDGRHGAAEYLGAGGAARSGCRGSGSPRSPRRTGPPATASWWRRSARAAACLASAVTARTWTSSRASPGSTSRARRRRRNGAARPQGHGVGLDLRAARARAIRRRAIVEPRRHKVLFTMTNAVKSGRLGTGTAHLYTVPYSKTGRPGGDAGSGRRLGRPAARSTTARTRATTG